MRDLLYWWVGWLVVNAACVWITAEVLLAFAKSISWCRWVRRMFVTHKAPPLNRPRSAMRVFPAIFFDRWSDFLFTREDMKWDGTGGYWHGIGNWEVHPPNNSP
jgi:hypothetical protein